MTPLFLSKITVLKFTFLYAILATDTGVFGSGCSNDLGMESKKIKKSQLSSNTNDNGWDADKGRLRNSGAWCSKTNNRWSEYFQIDLLSVRHVTAIATQGVKHWRLNYYVETYMIKYSYDGATWFYYEAENGADVTFTGNSNSDGVKTNFFRDTFVTRYLRIHPKTFHRDMCLRVEVYGCSDQDDDCSRYITSASGSIPSPGHPVNYPSNKDCTWLISVDSGKQITLMFTTFDVKRGSSAQGCQEDFVEVRNGLTDISRQIGGRYCNGNKPLLITTPRNMVRIRFHSGSTAISVSYKGFQIHYLALKPGSDDVFAVKGCDGDTIALNCSSSAYTINILHASYGSYPYSCGQQYTSIKCPVLDVESDIATECQDYKECRISLNGSLFGYSCPNNPAKGQLEVFYQCTSRKIKTPAPAPAPAPTTPPPPPSTQGGTEASSTVPPITTNSQPSNSFTDETTGSTLILPTEPFTTKPATALPTKVVASAGTDILPPTTPGGPSKSAVPSVGRREAQTGTGIPTGTMVGVIVVVIVVILVAGLIAVFLVRKKRLHKSKGEPLQVVTFTPEREYSMPENCPKRRCPLDVSNGAYETVNILYESADSPDESSATGKEDSNAYASCAVPKDAVKITENPLYNGVSPPGVKNSNEEGYELVKPPNVAAHKYESRSDNTSSKVKSINNPNYEKTLELKQNHEYHVPDRQVKPSC